MTERKLTPQEETLLAAQTRLMDAGTLVRTWRMVFRQSMGLGQPIRDQLQTIIAERRQPQPQGNPNQPLVAERFPRPLLSFVERFRQPVQPLQPQGEPGRNLTLEEEKAQRQVAEEYHRKELERLKKENLKRVRSLSDLSISEDI